ncbi:MAG: InlB B-repeat-containing protein, partial [Bacilli bacterium]|nr:InlB B-repeat-containing protein [Bacilli bacterium]
MRKIGIIILVVMFIFLYGCMPNQKITVSFETNGGSLIEDITIDSSLNFVLSDDPIKEGCEFAGWYSDIELTEVYEFSVMPAESIILYADWGTVGLEYELINNDTEYSVSKGTAIELTEIQIPNIKDGKLVTFIKDFVNCSNLKNIIIP